jgi:hypothetical protein
LSFKQKNLVAPLTADSILFVLRPLTIHHVVKDYDAVMTSRAHLWQRFGDVWNWPAVDLTLEQDLIDLAWHQKEFQINSSFAYAVLNAELSLVLGCVYIYPASTAEVDAEVWFWARQSELKNNLEHDLELFIIDWLAKSWPFDLVMLNGKCQTINGLKT